MKRTVAAAFFLAALLAVVAVHAGEPVVTIGSKAFAESWILGEALAGLARPHATAVHRRNLGGTEIVFGALLQGGVDVYPEYTGTIAEVILKADERPSLAVIRERLGAMGIGVSDPLGFNDGYALATTRAAAARYGLTKISDLARHPELKLAFTHEFIGRKDGYRGLAERYGLSMQDVRGLQHELGYEALASGQIDVMDIYTTDAQISRLGLVLLTDDREFFARYDAVLLYRLDLPGRATDAFVALSRLVGKIDEATMMRANARVLLEKESAEHAASAMLGEVLGAASGEAVSSPLAGLAKDVARNTARHLELVFASLFFAIALGVPLGVIATRSRALAVATLSGAGLLQTIPSLALLAFLIPLFGIGVVPALVALFLYSLLPIVQSTYTGLTTIPPALAEAAVAIGLPPRARLWKVLLPMASPTIMSGIKTSAVINVGTATLAALIGAEGLGNPIMEGIALRDTTRILEGAVPAALLALGVQWAFEGLARIVVPRGLRLRGESEGVA